MKADILLITPPFTQLNTPYPATAYLKGFLNTKSISSYQVDLGIEVILDLFSSKGLKEVFEMTSDKSNLSPNSKRILKLSHNYIKTIDGVIKFLQGNNPTMAYSICNDHFLPRASRFNHLLDTEWMFGTMGIQDKAKYLATLFIEDLSDFIVENIDPNFGFSRYAERIASSAHEFDALYDLTQHEDSLITKITLQKLKEYLHKVNPKLVLISIPFPGNLVQALKIGQFIKTNYSEVKVVMGGGFPNTELRALKEKRIFEFTDFICLDDGEAPVEQIYEYITKGTKIETLKRTFILEENEVKFVSNPVIKDYHQNEVGTPDYSDLKIGEYISVIEVANPMHNLWSNGRWNKLTLAHGCYWGKCTFCDISLDYIKNYQASSITITCNRIEELIAQTGQTGFHFVDEAAPPALLRDLALEILRRGLSISWWTNIRFEKSFTKDLCELLAKSGCIAVSGGVEVASDRILDLIKKGVDLVQLAQVCQHFSDTGILVHAYLMYGFPTQSEQETINALEVVRQMFENELINSGFWHQFAMTAHSPVGEGPELFKVESVLKTDGNFANNDRPHLDPFGAEHHKYSEGLKKSIFNYMNGVGLDLPLQDWFDFNVKPTTVSKSFVLDAINDAEPVILKPTNKIVFIEMIPQIESYEVKKKGKIKQMSKMVFESNDYQFVIKGTPKDIQFYRDFLTFISFQNDTLSTVKEVETFFNETSPSGFDTFLETDFFYDLKANGLLIL